MGGTLVRVYAGLSDQQLELARLVEVRTLRPWTTAEYERYLRLRREHAHLVDELQRVQHAFEIARSRLLNLELEANDVGS